jgi:hypothetical protein
MTASKSSFSRTNLVKALLKATAYTGPATIYLSLHTAAPGLAGANEVAGNAYARTVIAFGAEAGGTVSNTPAVTTPAPTPANWGTVTHFGLWDAATVGNFLGGDALTAAVATSIGVPLFFPIGSVTWSET